MLKLMAASIGAGGFFGDTIASRIAINFVDNTDTLPQSQAISDSGAVICVRAG